MEDSLNLIEKLITALLEAQKNTFKREIRISRTLEYVNSTDYPDVEKIKELLTGVKKEEDHETV